MLCRDRLRRTCYPAKVQPGMSKTACTSRNNNCIGSVYAMHSKVCLKYPSMLLN